MSPLGRSDHNNMYIVPKYGQLIIREKAIVKKIRLFDDSMVGKLQGCLVKMNLVKLLTRAKFGKNKIIYHKYF